MRYTKEIFDVLRKGGFISQNSVSQQYSRMYDAIEDNMEEYKNYFLQIGFLLEGGNGYYYFSRTEDKGILMNKLEKLAQWIDRVDFLKTYNNVFGSGFSFTKSNILEKFSNDIDLKEKARLLFPEAESHEEKLDKLINEMEKMNFIELENSIEGIYRVTAAFHYIEELIDCITITESAEE